MTLVSKLHCFTNSFPVKVESVHSHQETYSYETYDLMNLNTEYE
jgi:hypothetical protein